MVDRYTVDTPENIEFAYDIAGIGSRFLAAIIDSLIIVVAQALVLYLLGLATTSLPFAESVMVAVGALLSFLILWGYYIVFELVWSGQSPGKRAIGLRVVREGGRPITFTSAAIRNLVRIVDFLPALYGIGVVVMFIDRRARRLGDFAAGTLVVKERRGVTLASLTATAVPPPPPDAQPTLANVHLVGERDYALVQEFLGRRQELARDVRARLASQIAQGLQARLGIPQGGDAERFLQYVAAEYQIYHRSLER
ncbi:MAG TPA: RDD family protein [Roseiflexaceae bacterium]|nr:RDD family protein [Roseiflexaceae bacterium]